VDLARDESFGFLGFEFRRIRGRNGKWRPLKTPKIKKRTELLQNLKVTFRKHRSQPVDKLIAKINPVLRGWVNYFRIGNSSKCFSYIKDWVEKKVRRHLMKARGRRGFGWKRWIKAELYQKFGLYRDYQIRYYQPKLKALPVR